MFHGNPSWSYLHRNMVRGLAARGHRAIAVDLVGFGRSDKPADRTDYTYQRHVDWMHDAVAIRFTGEQTRGVGTRFLCDTRVGPITLVDRMEITEWEPAAVMGVRHTGIVTGSGRFTLEAIDLDRKSTRLNSSHRT